ncbi:hypothetical protein BN1221_02526 [Brenneria goodwinii]|uniref:Uncharacterized protein n=1 Tax=Brenneria goodwinii TaxID=1109412 RepID=A0A0G4JVX9_9GAMM|nr:hypothetical protein BN1221_02526 [Brenneria goodwinii]
MTRRRFHRPQFCYIHPILRTASCGVSLIILLFRRHFIPDFLQKLIAIPFLWL